MFSADKCLAPGFHPSRLCAVAAGDSSSRCRCPVKTHLSFSDLYACVYVYILYKSVCIYKHMYLSLALFIPTPQACMYKHCVFVLTRCVSVGIAPRWFADKLPARRLHVTRRENKSSKNRVEMTANLYHNEK